MKQKLSSDEKKQLKEIKDFERITKRAEKIADKMYEVNSKAEAKLQAALRS